MSVRVGIVGVGYWGINHVRAFASTEGAVVTHICDHSENRLQKAARFAPDAVLTDSLDVLLESRDLDAVVIATPAKTHAAIAVTALAAGKHVLIEKPMALSAVDAKRIETAWADSPSKVVAVGHLMLHHPVVETLRGLIEEGELGKIYYIHAARLNLGRVRHDENALWSLAPHDLSIIDYLLGDAPWSVSCYAADYLQDGIEDVAFVNLRYPSGCMAHVHVSWLEPRKERRLTVVGSKMMAVFDDVAPDKLVLYDKGYDQAPSFTSFGEFLQLRQGCATIPHIRMREPLAAQAADFVRSIQMGTPPRADVGSGVRVATALEAAGLANEMGQEVRL